MISSRTRSNIRRREREREYEAEDRLEARTTRLIDYTGRSVHMIDWTSEEIRAWKEKDNQCRAAVLSVQTLTPASSTQKKPNKKNWLGMILQLLSLGVRN